jgi:hypothetical protein
MSKEDHVIVGVHITNRLKHAQEVQSVFTSFGNCIKTRLGLHEINDPASSPVGLLLIEFVGGEDKCDEMLAKLSAVEGVDTQKMVFAH